MRRAHFGAQARRDLVEAWEYIADDSVSAAGAFIDRVDEATDLLTRMPGAGHRRADVDDPQLRFWLVRPYVIAYRFTSRTLTVVRIIHGARNFRKVFPKGR